MAIEGTVGQHFIALAEVGRPHKEGHPNIVKKGYIVPLPDLENSDLIASVLEKWIEEAPPGSITLRSKEWILDQWSKGRGIMVLGYPQGEESVDIFRDKGINEKTLEQHVVSIAFLNQLDGIPMEEEVELGTVLTNPHYQSNGYRRGVGGGVRAFQAVQDRAHEIFPNARLFSWVKNGSLQAINNAFSADVLEEYTIKDQAKAEVIFAACEGCPDSPGKGKCCHVGYEVKNEDLGLTFKQ